MQGEGVAGDLLVDPAGAGGAAQPGRGRAGGRARPMGRALECPREDQV
jgi:hypothetical protein